MKHAKLGTLDVGRIGLGTMGMSHRPHNVRVAVEGSGPQMTSRTTIGARPTRVSWVRTSSGTCG